MKFVTGTLFFLAASAIWANDYGRLPLGFEVNAGQTAPQVKFLSRGRNATFFLTSAGVLLRSGRDLTQVRFERANPSPRVSGVGELPGKSNYFIGNNPALWRTNVSTYAKVRYEGVYPGVDVIFYGNQRELEYDFVVAPGADPRAIRFSLSGRGKPTMDAAGDLVLGGLRLHRPVVYQESKGGRQRIGGRFVLHGRRAGFEVARYDRTEPLIIDPAVSLTYSTYLGGSGGDQGNGIAVDRSGDAYVVGTTSSSNFPASNAFQSSTGNQGCGGSCPDNAFVAKLNASGTALVYSTYLGGSSATQGLAIAVDSSGNAYVVGGTSYPGTFPTTSGAYQPSINGGSSGWVTKLNATGSALVYSTYFPAGIAGIALDSAGNAYLTGTTNGGLPATAGAFQFTAPGQEGAYVAKLNPSGSGLVYCTYLGGKDNAQGTGIAVDPSGNAYVTGITDSTDFPVKNPYQATLATQQATDSFVTAFNSTGSALIYSTYLGGSIDNQGGAIAVDSAGNAYVTGATNSPDQPTTPNAFQGAIQSGGAYQAYVAKFQPNGNVVYSTYFGSGFGGAFGYGIAVDSAGNAYMAGNGGGLYFPTQDPYQAAPGAATAENVIVAKFNPTGTALVYGTFLGGSNNDSGYAIAVDSAGNAYVTGGATSTNFPTVNAIQPKFGGAGGNQGYGDAFVAKLAAFPAGVVAPSILPNGVVNGASFGSGLVVGSWATIQGTNLAASAGEWDIVNGILRVKVNDVSVDFGGNDAYIYYVSPTQINFIVPDVRMGAQQVTVTNAAGTSQTVNITVTNFAPAFFSWPDNQVVATTESFAYVAANGTFSSATTPAKPGDTIILWGTGFGPTNPAFPQGMVTPATGGPYNAGKVSVTIGNLPATAYGAALAPGFAGLYQLAIQVPASLGNGNWPVVATIGGVSSPGNVILAVHQ